MNPIPAGEPADVSVDEFLFSMPERYKKRFDWVAARNHARIVSGRGERSAHADTFEFEGDLVLCVVAPDAPGVLAAISAGLMLTGFDIQRAEAYTRRTPDGAEAVDFFWIRRYHAVDGRAAPVRALSTRELDSVLFTLCELLEHGGALTKERIEPALTAGDAEASVRFLDDREGPILTLQVETNDRTGLLLTICAALFAEGVQIVGSRIRTLGHRASDQFDLLEADGSELQGTRLQRIKLSVLSALDAKGG
jgi:[protein-PII] uridylyltransferase